MVRANKLPPETLIRREDWTNWHPIDSVRGLLPEPFWIPGRLDLKAQKGALLGGGAGAVVGGALGAGGDLVSTIVSAVIFAVVGAFGGTAIAFVVWLASPHDSASVESFADQPEPVPEPASWWDKVAYAVGAVVLVLIFVVKTLAPAARQQNRTHPQQNQQSKPVTTRTGS